MEKSTTWYHLERYSQKITTVEVIKETRQQVVFIKTYWDKTKREVRTMKAGEFFPSFEDAHAELIKRLEETITKLERSLAHQRSQLTKARALTIKDYESAS